jgi:hypothetical protein
MDKQPLTPQATCGYPVDNRLLDVARAERARRGRPTLLGAVIRRLRRIQTP